MIEQKKNMKLCTVKENCKENILSEILRQHKAACMLTVWGVYARKPRFTVKGLKCTQGCKSSMLTGCLCGRLRECTETDLSDFMPERCQAHWPRQNVCWMKREKNSTVTASVSINCKKSAWMEATGLLLNSHDWPSQLKLSSGLMSRLALSLFGPIAATSQHTVGMQDSD